MADVLDEDFKTTVLKMLKELMQDMENVKKIMYKQNRNINKEIQNCKSFLRCIGTDL